jgi:hypothetical protein
VVGDRSGSAGARLLGDDLILIYGDKPPTRLRDQLLLHGRDRVGACPKLFLGGVQGHRQDLPRLGVAKPVAGAAAAELSRPWYRLGFEQFLGLVPLVSQPFDHGDPCEHVDLLVPGNTDVLPI